VRLLNHGKGIAVEPAARAPGGSEIRQLPHSYIGAFRQVSGQGQLLAASPRFEVRNACHRRLRDVMGPGCMSILLIGLYYIAWLGVLPNWVA
jgi:hypothetical protein